MLEAAILEIIGRFSGYVLPYEPTPHQNYWMWLPDTVPLEEVKQMLDDGRFPHSSELLLGIFFCFIFGVARLILQRILFTPLALYCMELTLEEETSLGSEADSFVSTRWKTATKESITAFCSENTNSNKKNSNSVTVTQKSVSLAIWKKKCNNVATKRITKFSEATWRFIFYITFLALGIYFHFIQFGGPVPWLRDTSLLWEWPHIPQAPFVMKVFYMIELGGYLHQAMWTEVSRSDSVEMLLHHFVTIALIVISYLPKYWRVGGLIMLIHDSADVVLEFAKCLNYMSKTEKFAWWTQPLTDILFGVFALTFFVTRLVIYPRMILWSWYTEAAWMQSRLWWVRHVITALLCALQCLHIFWFCLIMKMAYKLVFAGTVDADVRSDNEEAVGEFVDDSADAAADSPEKGGSNRRNSNSKPLVESKKKK